MTRRWYNRSKQPDDDWRTVALQLRQQLDEERDRWRYAFGVGVAVGLVLAIALEIYLRISQLR